MRTKGFENLVRTSISSLKEAGIVKSVNVICQLNENNRLVAILEGANSTFAEILIGRVSSEIILKKGGISESMINESSLVLLDDNMLGNRLRFTTTVYTDLANIFESPKDKRTKDLDFKRFTSIEKMLKSYWIQQ